MNRSHALRGVLAGAWLVATPTAEAMDTPVNIFAGVHVSWTGGQGPGLGLVFNPQLAMRGEHNRWPLLGLAITPTLTPGHGADIAFLLQGGLGVDADVQCTGGGVLDVDRAVLAQGGMRLVDNRARGVVGGLLAPHSNLRLEATGGFVDDAPVRGALSVGVPVEITPPCIVEVTEGRPLRKADGGCQAAQVWSAGPLPEAAEAWARRASDELAAVRAFVELADHLRSRGAPAELVRAAEHAAEDEVRHAALCLGMAARLGGMALSARAPSATGRPTPSLGVMAAESHLDGWDNEGRAAAEAAGRVATTADPIARGVDQVIAHDEARHASLGRSIDGWARHRGGRTARLERAVWLERFDHR